jgi:hypothetical protein
MMGGRELEFLLEKEDPSGPGDFLTASRSIASSAFTLASVFVCKPCFVQEECGDARDEKNQENVMFFHDMEWWVIQLSPNLFKCSIPFLARGKRFHELPGFVFRSILLHDSKVWRRTRS